jgi:hypothetical protein
MAPDQVYHFPVRSATPDADDKKIRILDHLEIGKLIATFGRRFHVGTFEAADFEFFRGKLRQRLRRAILVFTQHENGVGPGWVGGETRRHEKKQSWSN